MTEPPNRHPVGQLTAQLAALARIHGVAPSYTGTDGDEHPASPDAVVAALSALGVPINHPDGATDALAGEEAGHLQVLEPVVVHWTGSATMVTVVLPRHTHPRDVWLTLELESGQEYRRRLLAAISRPLTSGMVRGCQVDSYEVRLWSGNEALPPGYHHVTVEVNGDLHRSLVISAPRCPRPDRGWGVFLPLHAVRGDHDRGIGTFRDLADLTGWVGGLGGSFVGTLPLLPTFLEGDPVDPSPYLPVSRLAWNELFVDPTALPEFARSEGAMAAWGRQSDAPPGLVDYAAASKRVGSTLAPMARELLGTDSARHDELVAFVAARPHLQSYAAFRAERRHRGPDDEDVDQAIGATLYAQWVADTQLAEASSAGAALYLDLPVGINGDGFDPVWEPAAFVTGMTGGAPPDAFFSRGQDWGFPPSDPQGLRRTEYRYLIASLRHAMARASIVRIDHVMGLHRLFWIPQGGEPANGVYVDYPAEELRAVVALEAARSGTVVVGEDLGTVPDRLRADMEHDRMLRTWVLQFDGSPEEPLPEAPRHSMAGWGTHDLPTFAAYWHGRDIDERQENGVLTSDEAIRMQAERHAWRQSVAAELAIGIDQPEQALRGCLGRMAAGQALLTVVDLEDLWLEVEPQNRPGTGPGGANWRRRAAHSLSEFEGDPVVLAALTVVDGLRRAPSGARSGPGSPSFLPVDEGAP